MDDLKAQFEQAVADSKKLTEQPSNDSLLLLYALYKQATVGDAPAEGPSNPFDFIAKAKYNAWVEQRGTTSEKAMESYISVVQALKDTP